MKQIEFDLEDKKFVLTAKQVQAMLMENSRLTLLEAIDLFAAVEPHRTLTARRLLMPTILQIEAQNAAKH